MTPSEHCQPFHVIRLAIATFVVVKCQSKMTILSMQKKHSRAKTSSYYAILIRFKYWTELLLILLQTSRCLESCSMFFIKPPLPLVVFPICALVLVDQMALEMNGLAPSSVKVQSTECAFQWEKHSPGE